MKPLHARCTWIQMDATPVLHGLHEEKVTVSADENIGTVRHQSASNSLGISPRPSANVGHPDAAPPAFNVLMLRKVPANELVVYVAVDCDQGLY